MSNIIRDRHGNEVVFTGTERKLEIDVLRCRDFLARDFSFRSRIDREEFKSLLIIVLNAAEAMAIDSETIMEWVEKANSEAGFDDHPGMELNSRTELLAGRAIAGIGKSSWHRIIREQFERHRLKRMRA